MLFIQTILTFVACIPLVALAAPLVSQEAEGSKLATPESMTNNSPPASSSYSGPWSSFPAMNKWIGFEDMVRFPKHLSTQNLPCPLHSPWWMRSLLHPS